MIVGKPETGKQLQKTSSDPSRCLPSIMLRTGATRSVLRSLNASQPVHPSFQISVQTRQIRSQLCTLSSRRPQTIANAIPKPTTTSILRRQVSHSRPLLQLSKYDKPDTEHERKVAEQKLKATPDTVSTTSSIHPVMGEVGVHDPEDKPEVSGGIKADLVSGNVLSVALKEHSLTSNRKPSKIPFL